MTLSVRVASVIDRVVQERAAPGGVEDSFFVMDPDALAAQLKLWREHLPGITPHYAVKCNNHREIVSRLHEWGVHFDCASQNEIQSVLELGAAPSDIVYANPVKAPSQLRFAAGAGVKRMTFDNIDELHKISKHAPGSELLLRIKTDDSGAVCSLSCKFGASPQQAQELLSTAKLLGLNVVGVAYHVGSGGGTGPAAHAQALRDARELFDVARTAGFSFSVLDIGGGFEPRPEDFVPVAAQIRKSLVELQFPSGVEIMGEPGRFFVAPVLTLVASVIGVRRAPSTAQDGEHDMVYITDGVYGNLNSIIYDHQLPQAHIVGGDATGATETASLWGPTCDGLDNIAEAAKLSRRPEIGDWLYFPDSGAYTLVGESAFNGFNTNTQLYVA